MTTKPECDIVLNEQEKRLIELLREIGYGEVTVYVKDHHPYRVEQVRKSIVL